MDNTNAQDLEQVLQGEYHGQENSLMKKLDLFFHLTLLMGLNGSIFSLIIHIDCLIIFHNIVYFLGGIFFIKYIYITNLLFDSAYMRITTGPFCYSYNWALELTISDIFENCFSPALFARALQPFRKCPCAS